MLLLLLLLLLFAVLFFCECGLLFGMTLFLPPKVYILPQFLANTKTRQRRKAARILRKGEYDEICAPKNMYIKQSRD